MNANSEGGDQICSWNGPSNAYKISLFNQTVYKRHMKSECIIDIGFVNLRASNREDMRGKVTLVKSNTDMTSLTCAGSVMVDIFN